MIPLIVMLAVGLLSALWPGPKLDHEPPRSGGIFAPRIDNRDGSALAELADNWVIEDTTTTYPVRRIQSFGACASVVVSTVVVSTDGIKTVVQCDGGTN